MEFSVRSFAVVSLLLLVSLSTDMSGPLVVDAIYCSPNPCVKICGSVTACCPFGGKCDCNAIFCPLADSVKKEITEEVMAVAADEEPFIKEVVIA